MLQQRQWKTDALQVLKKFEDQVDFDEVQRNQLQIRPHLIKSSFIIEVILYAFINHSFIEISPNLISNTTHDLLKGGPRCPQGRLRWKRSRGASSVEFHRLTPILHHCDHHNWYGHILKL